MLRLTAVLMFAAAGSGAATAPREIDISQFAFKPQEITVAAGTEVTWVNRDQTIHSVIAQGGGFSSRGLDTGDRFTMVFEHGGDFIYICSLHPFMKGVVHVRESIGKAP